jgi:SAM-dependent methyltransferase
MITHARSGPIVRHDETVRRFAAATERNREPILAVLQRVFPERGTALEIASGTGEHAVFFARALPQLQWQPSDHEDEQLASIAAWRDEAGTPNLLPALRVDVHADDWPVAQVDAVFCANMIHIAPWSACEGLMRGVGRVLAPGGIMVLYGPFHIGGKPTADSNAAFDQRLRATDPSWGVRHLEDVTALAEQHGLTLRERIAMPANNFSLVFIRE